MVEITFTNERDETIKKYFDTIDDAMDFLSLRTDKSYIAKIDLKGEK